MISYPIRTKGSLLPVSPHHGHALDKATGIKKLIYKLLPRHVLLPLKHELYCSWIRLKTRNTFKRYQKCNNLKVNVGSGSRGKNGWVNVDLYNAKGVNCIYDCRHHLPFNDSSVSLLFTEHFLEHIDYTEDIPFFLTECYRVLEPGGIIRIVVPDTEKYIRAYLERDWNALAEINGNINTQGKDLYFNSDYTTILQALNFTFRQGHHHKYAYDFETLYDALSRYGFTGIKRWDYGSSSQPEVCIDAPDRAPESLYVEATK